jgi:hypothetical protein
MEYEEEQKCRCIAKLLYGMVKVIILVIGIIFISILIVYCRK